MKQFKGKLDADQNGLLDKEEFTKWVQTQFALPGAPLARQRNTSGQFSHIQKHPDRPLGL